jgi:hypothetical protein
MQNISYPQLKKLCAENGVSAVGKRAELEARLTNLPMDQLVGKAPKPKIITEDELADFVEDKVVSSVMMRAKVQDVADRLHKVMLNELTRMRRNYTVRAEVYENDGNFSVELIGGPQVQHSLPIHLKYLEKDMPVLERCAKNFVGGTVNNLSSVGGPVW